MKNTRCEENISITRQEKICLFKARKNLKNTRWKKIDQSLKMVGEYLPNTVQYSGKYAKYKAREKLPYSSFSQSLLPCFGFLYIF